MPSIVVTPKYNPFTFDELYKPLAETTKMQMALEDQYNAMEMEAAKLDYLQNSDPEAYAVVKNYKDTLRGLAGELASNGLTPQSRQGVYDMRKMYSSDVEPINKYIAWKDAQAKSRQAMRDKDSTYMWEIPLEKVKYNTWKENPNIVFRGASGEALSKNVADAVKFLQNKWTSDPTIKELSSKYPELAGMFREEEEYGISKEQLNKFLSEAPEEDKQKVLGVYNKLLNYAINQVANMHGLNDWDNASDVEMWKKSSLENGLWAALGKQADQLITSPTAGKDSGKVSEELDPNYPDVIFESLLGSTDYDGLAYIKDKDKFTNKDIYRVNSKGERYGEVSFTLSDGQNLIPTSNVENVKNDAYEDFKNRKISYLRGPKGVIDENGFHPEKISNPPKGEEPLYGVTLEVSPLTALAYDLVYYTKVAPEKDKLSKEEILDKYIFGNSENYTISNVATDDLYKTNFTEKDIKLYDKENNKLLGININEAEKLLNNRIEQIQANTDAAIFSHGRFKADKSDALEWLNETANVEGGNSGEINTVQYKYNKDKKDFEIVDTGDKVNISKLKNEDIKSIVPYYSPRGIILRVQTTDGTFTVKAHVSNNVMSEINRKFASIEEGEKLLNEAYYNYINSTSVDDAKKYYNDMTELRKARTSLYVEIQRALSRMIKHNEAEPTKYN